LLGVESGLVRGCSCGFLILAGFEGVICGDKALSGALSDKAAPKVGGIAV
jgi:hypothetical protein